jgi:hypothetical protein
MNSIHSRVGECNDDLSPIDTIASQLEPQLIFRIADDMLTTSTTQRVARRTFHGVVGSGRSIKRLHSLTRVCQLQGGCPFTGPVEQVMDPLEQEIKRRPQKQAQGVVLWRRQGRR